jgi:pyruvate dehydrogenase (quinone)
VSNNVSDFLIDRLCTWGVRRIYGYPGDGINGLMGALARRQSDITFIQARHEEMAAFMACGHAKFTGELGVCLATSGPGAIHLLNGLYDARMDHQPVLAIVGQQPRTALGGEQQQEVDLPTLFKDVAREYVHTLLVPNQLPMMVDRAVRIALAERTVTCIIVPHDVQEEKAAYEPPHEFKITPGGLGYAAPRVMPSGVEIERAADVLNAGERVAILVGQGARHALDEVLEIAERLGAGVAKALLGKDVVPDDLPYVTGAIGLLGTRPSYELMMGCDTLLMIGSSFPYFQFLPEPGQARGVQIDIDARMIGIRYPMEVNLVGDSRETLRALAPRLDVKRDRGWREKIEKEVSDWWQVMEARAMRDARPLNPQRLFWELSPRLPERAILTCDSGSAANWYARDLRFRRGMRGSLSGNLATMGSGVPYAIAAKFAHPERPVIALVGDGAMQMNGLAELLTVAKYWRRWSDPRFVVLVLDNCDLNQVTWEMRAMSGDPKFEDSQVLPGMDYAGFAESIGFAALRIDSPEQVAPAWDRAFASDRPFLIDAITDPEIPPIPPHVTIDQAVSLTRAVLRGDPEGGRILRESLRGKAEEFLPHRAKG